MDDHELETRPGPRGGICKVCGKWDDIILGVCYYCATDAEERLAKCTVLRHHDITQSYCRRLVRSLLGGIAVGISIAFGQLPQLHGNRSTMMLTEKQIEAITPDAREGIVKGIMMCGPEFMDLAGFEGQAHRFVCLWANLCWESDHLRTTSEYANGDAYEGRIDLGNVHPGDGPKFKGHGLLQITGRANHEAYGEWAMEQGVLSNAMDTLNDPIILTMFPHALLAAAWYWSVGNPTGESMNALADDKNFKACCRTINGAYTHLASRWTYFERTTLVILGHPLTSLYTLHSGEIAAFQKEAKITVDGVSGPQTRNAMFEALMDMEAYSSNRDLDEVKELISRAQLLLVQASDRINAISEQKFELIRPDNVLDNPEEDEDV